jgi:hypothetical protein
MTPRSPCRRDLRHSFARRRGPLERRSRRFECLEPRCLLSLDGLGPLADGLDDSPPQSLLTADDVLGGGGETYQFTVEYSDDVAVDGSDFDDWDILVAGPRFRRSATFVGVPNPVAVWTKWR